MSALTAPAVPLPLAPPEPDPGPHWDPVAFSVSADSAHCDDHDLTARPQLVWSNGRRRELPDPQAWAGTVARACVEALRGTRPAGQLHRWLDPEVFTALHRRAALAARIRRRPPRGRAVRIRRVRPCRVAPGIWEAAVVLVDGNRVRAAAVRIEEHRGHWRATAVQIA